MLKIGVVGTFGEGSLFSGGQPVKTKLVIDELKNRIGNTSVLTANTYRWRRRPLNLLLDIFNLFHDCNNILMLPAKNGLTIFSIIFHIINTFYKKEIHYIVIGGWLPSFLSNNRVVYKLISHYKGIYVETKTMKEELEILGLTNVFLMNNFKSLIKCEIKNFDKIIDFPIKICYFSRVIKEKGIEDAIQVVKNINNKNNKIIYELDIYGKIGKGYEEEFLKIIEKSPNFITYCNVIDPSQSVGTLSKYLVQIFPTHYKTEGIPGSIIDSYFAGVPVIASRWNSFGDVIEEGITGFGYELGNIKDLERQMDEISKKPEEIFKLKKNCINKSYEYSPDYVINTFIKQLKKSGL